MKENSVEQNNETIKELQDIFSTHKERKISVVGTTCTGKSTLIKNFPQAKELRDIAPTLSEEEKSIFNKTPWTIEIGEAVKKMRGEKAKIKAGEPVFGTVIAKGSDLIIYLDIDDKLLKQRTIARNVSFEDAKNMQRWILEEINKSGLETINIKVK
ncbi:MAG: hypothetical protein KBC44_02340 [Candidatus Pacebacteria bacterium]|nr:hypothetical protein [Candidatus Paceibacterota bacterium]MBP9839797.1 hypothetical protein [Candidatus Paceibacterota bacterium]